jgi:hypothetical protein
MEKINIDTLYQETQKKLWNIQNEYNQGKVIIAVVTFFAFLVTIWWLLPFGVSIYILIKWFYAFLDVGFRVLPNILFMAGFCFFMSVLFFRFPFWYFISRHWNLKNYEFAAHAIKLNKDLIESYDKISTMDYILQKTEHILQVTDSILSMRNIKFPAIFNILGYKHLAWKLVLDWIYWEGLVGEINFLWKILTDLRSDLNIRLTEQQMVLESAKSEVDSNIKWTTELEQVSELQKIRLDKQIEQFEELQRVLVKV